MEKQCDLRNVAGAWVETGHTGFVRVAVKAEYNLGAVTPRVRRVVVNALRTGVIGSTGGLAANVFTVVSNAFGLKYVCASKEGRHFYTNFNDKDFYDSVVAIVALDGSTRRGRDASSYVSSYRNSIVTWSWRGGPLIVQEVYKRTIGYKDKKIREDAIDFLCANGKLVNTWIDNSPR
jgi:hypothetical protein